MSQVHFSWRTGNVNAVVEIRICCNFFSLYSRHFLMGYEVCHLIFFKYSPNFLLPSFFFFPEYVH